MIFLNIHPVSQITFISFLVGTDKGISFLTANISIMGSYPIYTPSIPYKQYITSLTKSISEIFIDEFYFRILIILLSL